MTTSEANWRERISARSGVLTGKPAVRNTRISVEFVLGMLARGVPRAEILEEYPSLNAQDLDACLSYAAELVASERHYPLSA
jgi:uncharacterized protein (DUF433 family)